ncbi:hypothetical protein PM082_013761 [Marasmius tenuissimus]|nr:hypothetical protein PM082_013761 [Marasmius tenuissimus]
MWGCTDDAARKFAGGTANSGASAGSAIPEILQLVPRPPCPGLVKLEENTEPDELQHRQQQQGNDVLQDNTGLREHERLEEQLLSLRMNQRMNWSKNLYEEPQVPQDYGAEIDALFRELVAEIESMNFEEPEEGSSQGRTRRPNIMLPKVITLPPVHNVPDIRSSSERRNPRRQSEQKPSEYQHHLKNGLRFIQKFTLPFTFDELVAKSNNKKATLNELEQEVKEMEKESYAIQAGSALFYTKDKVLVFVYLGCRTSDMITTIGDDNFLELSQCSMEERLQSTLERKEAEIREAEEQQLLAQSNRRRHGQRPPKTPSSSTKNMMERLYITSHFMAAYNIPKGDTSRKRHGIDHDGHTYHYFDIEEGIEFTEDENQSRNMVFSEDGGKTALNSAGVFHMAEAWPQAKHKKNELYMGSALTGSGQSTLGTRYFYQANEVLEKCVAIAVKAFFPEIHEIGAKVREAGRTVPTSDGKPCGMYLARAIIFKLQVLLHTQHKTPNFHARGIEAVQTPNRVTAVLWGHHIEQSMPHPVRPTTFIFPSTTAPENSSTPAPTVPSPQVPQFAIDPRLLSEKTPVMAAENRSSGGGRGMEKAQFIAELNNAREDIKTLKNKTGGLEDELALLKNAQAREAKDAEDTREKLVLVLVFFRAW